MNRFPCRFGRIGMLLLLLLSACATVPPELQGPVVPATLVEVRAHPDDYRGRQVRWGGTILKLENGEKETRIQILARPLDRSGRPRLNVEPEGRFLAVTPAFLDPEIYPRGRELTVIGRIDGTAEITVGKRTIRVPVVAAERWHLWPKRKSNPPVMVYPYFRYWWYYSWGPCCWY